jgi:hypothetical protein
VEFEIGSGLTFEDREFQDKEMVERAKKEPGKRLTGNFNGKRIKLGSTITFKYRELSDDGIPKEGRYWRRREGVE